MKQYLVNNPLILQDESGEDYRVERGEVIALSDTQYAEVAAHVTLWATAEQVGQPETATQNPPENSAETQTPPEQTSETSANSEQTQSEQAQSKNPQENQTETPAETTDKPKRGGKTKESAA